MLTTIARLFYPKHTPQWFNLHPLPLSALPEHYRACLRVSDLLTPHLEQVINSSLQLQVLHTLIDTPYLYRKIILSNQQNTPIEFAIIRIALDKLPAATRQQVIAGTMPLGTILANSQSNISVTPNYFFSTQADAELSQQLMLPAGQTNLYGRYSVLRNDDGQSIAESLEILYLDNGARGQSRTGTG